MLDSVFLFDIILSFFTDNYSVPGQHITNKEIIGRYIRGLFFWDMAQCIPGLAVMERYEAKAWLYKTKILRYAQIPKTMGQIQNVLQFKTIFKQQHSQANFQVIIFTIFQFMLALHLFACGWILVGNCDHPDNDISCVEEYSHGWIYRDSANIDMLPEDMKGLYIYISSLYFISTTATTIGYGDFGANTLLEFYYMIFV